MKRVLYLSLIRSGKEALLADLLQAWSDSAAGSLKSLGVVTLTVFRADPHLCVYLDCTRDPEFDWPEEFGSVLEPCPSLDGSAPKLVQPMVDIFHDGVPADPESWYGGRRVEGRAGALARLKPEQYSSYVYYHYLKQEEEPEEFNKTYMIGAAGTLIFSYSEHPAVTSEPKPQGKLDTKLVPANWQETMIPHFDPWPTESGKPLYWKAMQHVLTLDYYHAD